MYAPKKAKGANLKSTSRLGKSRTNNLKVLLVEDEPLLRDSYRLILERSLSPNVTAASNGEEALALCEDQDYDLILLDIMMPHLDGIGFLEKYSASLRKAKKARSKIVVLSNISAGDKIKRALNLGASAYLEKSQIGPSELVAALRQELRGTK